jgi:hypothetical protein
MTTQKRKDLSIRYPYIVAYDKIMCSLQYWTDMQLANAERLNAPGHTISCSEIKFETLDSITNPDFRKLLNLGWLDELKSQIPDFKI